MHFLFIYFYYTKKFTFVIDQENLCNQYTKENKLVNAHRIFFFEKGECSP